MNIQQQIEKEQKRGTQQKSYFIITLNIQSPLYWILDKITKEKINKIRKNQKQKKMK